MKVFISSGLALITVVSSLGFQNNNHKQSATFRHANDLRPAEECIKTCLDEAIDRNNKSKYIAPWKNGMQSENEFPSNNNTRMPNDSQYGSQQSYNSYPGYSADQNTKEPYLSPYPPPYSQQSQHSNQPQHSNQSQYPNQGQYPNQSQYPNQGQHSNQSQYSNQGQYPNQGQNFQPSLYYTQEPSNPFLDYQNESQPTQNEPQNQYQINGYSGPSDLTRVGNSDKYHFTSPGIEQKREPQSQYNPVNFNQETSQKLSQDPTPISASVPITKLPVEGVQYEIRVREGNRSIVATMKSNDAKSYEIKAESGPGSLFTIKKSSKSGIFHIFSVLGTNLALDVFQRNEKSGAKMTLHGFSNQWNQEFKFNYAKRWRTKSYFTISNAQTGKYLQVNADGSLTQEDRARNDSQKFDLYKRA